MSLALSACALLVSLVQLVNGEQLNITFLLVVFASVSASAVLVTVIIF